MTDQEREKVRRFMNDEVMAKAVQQFLLGSFLKERSGQDIYLLAASRMSVDCLNRAFKEMASFVEVKEAKNGLVDNIGL